MDFHASAQTSSLDRVLAASLAAFSMFVVGYTATRICLSHTSGQNALADSNIIPHQAALWSDLSR